MAGPFIFFFIAGGSPGHGITFWAILLYCSSIIFVMAAAAAVLGIPVKRRVIRKQLSATEFIRWKDLIPSLTLESFSVTGSLIFTVYALEEWVVAGSTYHGDRWMVVFLLGAALLSPLIMIIAHVSLLSRQAGDRWTGVSLAQRVCLAFQLGLVTPGVFGVVVMGLLLALPK